MTPFLIQKQRRPKLYDVKKNMKKHNCNFAHHKQTFVDEGLKKR